MNRLNWEINNRAAWNDGAARHSPHTSKQPLSDTEIESRRRELQQLAGTSFGWRAFTYFMGCFACQTFWVSLVVFAVSGGTSSAADWIFSAAAYSGAAATLATVQSSIWSRPAPDPGTKPSCKHCSG